MSRVNRPGTFITVERTSVSSGSPTESANISAANPVAPQRQRPSGLSRSIEPFEPMVTNRRASRIRYASMVRVRTPISMIAPASTAATPDCREAMFW